MVLFLMCETCEKGLRHIVWNKVYTPENLTRHLKRGPLIRIVVCTESFLGSMLVLGNLRCV